MNVLICFGLLFGNGPFLLVKNGDVKIDIDRMQGFSIVNFARSPIVSLQSLDLIFSQSHIMQFEQGEECFLLNCAYLIYIEKFQKKST